MSAALGELPMSCGEYAGQKWKQDGFYADWNRCPNCRGLVEIRGFSFRSEPEICNYETPLTYCYGGYLRTKEETND